MKVVIVDDSAEIRERLTAIAKGRDHLVGSFQVMDAGRDHVPAGRFQGIWSN